jgi:acetyl-CoA C-acetyltransferase
MMDVEITATSQIKFGEHWTKNIEDLAREALEPIRQQCRQADMLYVSTTFARDVLASGNLANHLRDQLALTLPVRLVTDAGDASGALAIRLAARAIESGEISRAVVLGVEKISDLLSGQIESLFARLLDPEEQFQGLTMAGAYALITPAVLKKYKLTREDLARVAVSNHAHGANNPTAYYPFKVTLDQVLGSPFVAEPLRVLDCASLCDGAAALVLEKTNDKQGIHLVATGYGLDQLALCRRADVSTSQATRQAAQDAYAQADIHASSIGIAEVHDVVTTSEVMALTDLGLAKTATFKQWFGPRGKAPDWINPSGGLKACGHAAGATAIRQTIEIVEQLRGNAGKRQVKGATCGLTHSLNGSGSEAFVHIFKLKA